MQVADAVFPALDIPERAIRYELIAALLGFPAAIVFGWFYDVGMDGIRRTAPAGPEDTAAALPLRRTDYLIRLPSRSPPVSPRGRGLTGTIGSAGSRR